MSIKFDMLTKNKYKNYSNTIVNQLNDVRFLGRTLFVVIMLLITWSGIKTVQTNYTLQKQITALGQQNYLQKLQNENLQLQNQYYSSNQFVELSARQNFGLAAPGEKEVIVPNQVALADTVNLPNSDYQSLTTSKKSKLQSNFESWVNFLLDRDR
ncbi:MAG TPA: septum formation initiator family protein [Candidatus Sulfotelmatobacter sp.]|nr:septum formation initiator family protein [Candidatus Sulfotelmatobacter sp.]